MCAFFFVFPASAFPLKGIFEVATFGNTIQVPLFFSQDFHYLVNERVNFTKFCEKVKTSKTTKTDWNLEMRNHDMTIPKKNGIYTYGLIFTKPYNASENRLICVKVRKLSRKYCPMPPAFWPHHPT